MPTCADMKSLARPGGPLSVASLLFACLCLSLAGSGSLMAAQTPYGEVSVRFDLHKVPGSEIYYVIGQSGVPDATNEGFTSNAGFVVTSQGVVVYDALGTPALGYMLLKRIREVTEKPVKIVVAGHYHADHVYGLQAFTEHARAEIWAHRSALDYVGSEDAKRRLAQRREALFPWVDKNTHVVSPDKTYQSAHTFDMGDTHIELLYMGPAHSPSDTLMAVKEAGVIFSGDIIFGGRLPFLDSPQVDTGNWLKGLAHVRALEPEPRYVIPGHGEASTDPTQAIDFTANYIEYLRKSMGAAAEELTPFDQAYETTDWSSYEGVPTFHAANRRNAYRVYLEMQAEMF